MHRNSKFMNGFEISHEKENIRKAGDTKFIIIV